MKFVETDRNYELIDFEFVIIYTNDMWLKKIKGPKTISLVRPEV